MALLQLKQLTVRFGGLTAVDKVTCAVDEKQIFSMIGPNGAGKTTVFNAISGIYEPTEGSIEFLGRPLARTLTWRVVATCALLGLFTGLASALAMINLDTLWRTTIKRNYGGPGETMSYSAAWKDAVNYWQGRLTLDRMRKGRWAVRTADGRNTLAYASSIEEAEQARAHYEQLLARAASPDALVERDGKWIVPNEHGGKPLASFDSPADGRAVMEKYAAIAREPIAHRRNALLALFLGAAIGAAGSWTVWHRARRTPEVIARAGIARTFQNIRLFQNMTVLENVLTGMDQRMPGGALPMALQLPSVRRRESAARDEARKLLAFVRLKGKENMLAKNLPYGDQRRLEIARALAGKPRLVLLDEPAAGMNPTESVELNDLIEQIRARGLTVLLIEHHMKVVMGISDRIAVLEYGVKIAEGTPEQIRNDPRVIAAYLGSEEVS